MVGGGGGTGGNGALGGAIVGAGGGGGGGSGAGVIVNGASITYTNALGGILFGGNGGIGGNGAGSGNGGNGGDGGSGIVFTTGGDTLINNGSIVGGNGGHGGNGGASGTAGNDGANGVGVVGSGLTVIDSGTINGAFTPIHGTANAITFTGGSNILELQSGYSISGNVVGTGSDTFRLGGSSNASFDVSSIGSSAQYQGFSTFIKTGSSTWTLTGTAVQTTSWTIDAGILTVNGSLTPSSVTTVNIGGGLDGTGTVGSLQVNNGGTFAPGLGTLGQAMTVAGNLAFQSGAIYLIALNPATSTITNVTNGGTTTINGGTVQAVFSPGTYVAHQYDIIHSAAGLSGGFTTLDTTGLPAGFTANLSYTGTDAFLNLVATLGSGIGSGGLNQNQRNVANALNNFFNNGGTLPPGFLTVFGLTGSTLANTLSQLDGENATDAEKGAFQFMTEYLTLMLDPFVDGRGGFGVGG